MAGRMGFRTKLGEVLQMAIEQDCKITIDEVEKFFEEDQLSGEQINLVCEYLMSQKIAVSGYQQSAGTVKEKTEEPEKLSAEEQEYIQAYTNDIASMKAANKQEKKLAAYLPKVVEEALRLHHSEIFIGDMIQEGNISLMLALENKEADDAVIMEHIRASMRALIESQTEIKRQDKKMVEKVSVLDEVLEEMNGEFGRKVTLDEVAERLGISEEQVEDILKLAGEKAEE